MTSEAAGATARSPRELIERCNRVESEVLRRAVEYVSLSAHRPIGIDDIAAAAGVGPRALQLAFRRYADTTPWAYVRSVRLDSAHRDLQLADPRRDSVVAIASRWGFSNRSRFSAEYRAVYGETPADTLRGRPLPERAVDPGTRALTRGFRPLPKAGAVS